MRTTLKQGAQLFAFFTLAILLTNCEENKKKDADDDKPKIEKPTNIISLEEADVIYENYSKHRINIIEAYENERAPEESFQASRFVDFDYDALKQYISYVDQEAKEAGVKKVTKLRLYFANYPGEKEFPNKKKVVHPRQNSVFMVPTLNKDGVNYAFYIDKNGKAALVSDWKANLTKEVGQLLNEPKQDYAGFTLNSSLQGGTSLAYNFGHGGPPPKTDF